MKNKIIMSGLVFLVFTLVFMIDVKVFSEYIVPNTKTGENDCITWSINEDGKLSIRGSGDWSREDFSDCPWKIYLEDIKSVDITNFDMSKSKDLSYMFADLKYIEEINFGSVKAGKLENTSSMFTGCESLKKLDLSKFDTSNVVDMCNMFTNCASLEELNISNFDTSNVEDMTSMFAGCESLRKIDLSSFDTKSVKLMSFMFSGCNSLEEIDLSNFNTDNVLDMWAMFSNCTSLEELNLSNFKTFDVSDMSDMFSNCINLKKLDISNFSGYSLQTAANMFSGCKLLEELDLSNFDTKNEISTSGEIDLSYMFYECSSLKELDLRRFDLSNVKNMSYMFYYCKNLENIKMNNFDLSNVDNISNMFEGCDSLKNIDISRFKLEKVYPLMQSTEGSTNLKYMSGYNDNTFRPNNTITRGEVAAIVNRISAEGALRINLDYENKFTDVKESTWCNKEIGFCAKEKIMVGYPNGKFGVNDTMVKSEFASLIVRFFDIDCEGKKSNFNDVKGKWFEKYVAVLEEMKILRENEQTFGAKENINRAEVCYLINQLLGRTKESKTEIFEYESNFSFTDVKPSDWYYNDVFLATVEVTPNN